MKMFLKKIDVNLIKKKDCNFWLQWPRSCTRSKSQR